jgi:hypothetical protein
MRGPNDPAPSDISIKEVLQPYIILDANQSSFSVVPTTINETEDGTIIEGRNISHHVGNSHRTLDANEIFIIKFKIASSSTGNGMPIGINGSSLITWISGEDGMQKSLPLSESHLNVFPEVHRETATSNRLT